MRTTAMLASLALAAGVLVGAAAPAYADPAVGDCLDMPANSGPFDPLVTGTAVECDAPHNGEVFGLAEYPADWGKPSEEREQLEDFGWVNQVCSFNSLDEWLMESGAPQLSISTRLFLKAGAPSDEAWEAGDRTVQCIVFAMSGPFGRERMTAWSGAMAAKLGTPEGVKFFARCSKAKPLSGKDNAIYECKSAKQWVGVARVFNLKGTPAGKKFPAPATQKDADAKCAKAAKKFVKGKAKAFGAVEPRFMWDEGFKEAVCYLPLQSWNGKGGV